MTKTKKRMFGAAAFVIGSVISVVAIGADVDVKLGGSNEVPAVTTSATGEGKFMIGGDGSVSGSVTTKGIEGIMAHIHVGAAGKNGPVIIPLTKEGDTFAVPAGAKLTPDQMKAFEAGDLYVNVHSAAHKGGEIRGQLMK